MYKMRRRENNKIVEEGINKCNSQTKLKYRVFSSTLCICVCVLFIYNLYLALNKKT